MIFADFNESPEFVVGYDIHTLAAIVESLGDAPHHLIEDNIKPLHAVMTKLFYLILAAEQRISRRRRNEQ